MTISDIQVGRVYRSKKPKAIGIFDPLYDDRQILWIGSTTLQYESPTVKIGRKYPTVDIDKFLKWGDRDVTDELPKGEWATYP